MVDKEPKSFSEIAEETVGPARQKNLAEILATMATGTQVIKTTINEKADEIRYSYEPLCTTVWRITSGEELKEMLAEYFINESEAYNKAQPAYNKKE